MRRPVLVLSMSVVGVCGILAAACNNSVIQTRPELVAIPANCQVSGEDSILPVITKGQDQYNCVKWTAATEGPLQNVTTQRISSSGCGPQTFTVTTALFKGAGSLSDDTNGDYPGHAAFVVGTITNNSHNCTWTGTHFTLAANTTYYIVVFGNGKNVYLVPPAGPNQTLQFRSCKSDNQGGNSAAGDYAYLKEDNSRCDHLGPSFVVGNPRDEESHGGPRAPDISDSAVLWLACSMDCCYAQQ